MNAPRLLLILSNDYGELSTALALAEGQGFDVAMALPKRLDSAAAGARAHGYASFQDLVALMHVERPDAVLLFSGYLLALNRLMHVNAVEALLAEIRRRGLPTATTDPFLGVLSEITARTFADAHPLRAALTEHFRQVSGIFRDVVHLYPVAPPNPRGLSFFNPLAYPNAPSAPSQKPSWLFVLSAEDYAAQAARVGPDRFTSLLSDRIGDALRHGRQAILVGPEPCVRVLKDDARSRPASLLTFCPPAIFRPLLMAAEHAFYWNIVSNSLLPRVMNRLPVMFFDRGHLLHAVPPMLDAAVRHYYRDNEPSYLSMADELEPARLARLASDHLRAMEPTVAHIRSQPAPREMIERLMRRACHVA